MRIKKYTSVLFITLLLLSGCQSTDELKTTVGDSIKTTVVDAVGDAVEDKVTDIAGEAVGEMAEGVVESGVSEGLGSNSTSTSTKFTVKIESVTDGDTIKFKDPNSNSKQLVTMRVLNVDTPEVHGPKAGQLYGEEASEFAKRTLEGKDVTIELSAKESPYDNYGRLLGYVFIDDQLYEELIIKEGLARVAYVYSPDTKYQEQLQEAEQQARTKGENIWSIPGYVTDKGYDMNVVKKAS